MFVIFSFFFFFQAEDGIRYRTVTGVQTCALPICATSGPARRSPPAMRHRRARSPAARAPGSSVALRGQVGEVVAERVPDERVELDRHLAGGICELAQAQDQRRT